MFNLKCFRPTDQDTVDVRPPSQDGEAPTPHLPERFSLGFKTFAVRTGQDAKLVCDGNLGMSGFSDGFIAVDEDRLTSRQEVADTVIHECLHIIFKQYHLHEELAEHEEKVVSTLAHGLTELFGRNPDLARWYTAMARQQDG